jgi:hypothetical protein
MSKTPEQVVSEAIESHWKTALNMHGPICASGTSFGVVSALRSAGLLREPNDGACQVVCERDELRRMLAVKERERDEAIAGREKWAREYRLSLATQRTPAESELCDAVVAHLANDKFAFADNTHGVFAAARALAAERAPKPRYEAVASSGGWQEGGMVRDIRTQELAFGSWRGICDDNSLAAFHKARCEAECARLNAADALGVGDSE